MSQRRSIALEKKSYRKGVILGLTMAEAMILFLFSLLLAIAAVIQNDKSNDNLEITELNKRELIDKYSLLQKELNKSEAILLEIFQKSDGNLDMKRTDWKKIGEFARVTKSNENWRELIEFVESYNNLDDKPSFKQIIDFIPIIETISESDLMSSEIETTNSKLKNTLSHYNENTNGVNIWPPIINLSEAAGYSFKVGSSKLTPEFKELLKTDITDQLLRIITEYNVDLIEVIGHTDEQPLSKRSSNLDAHILSVINGNSAAETLLPADNAGLGLVRAVSVAKALQSNPLLKSITILPYSGAQLILPGDQISTGTSTGNNKQRRRIEIRVRRSEKLNSINN